MNRPAPNYDDWKIGRFFDHLCGRIAIDGDCENKSYWIGAMLAASKNYEAAIKILFDFLEAEIVANVRKVVETLIQRIYTELEAS